MKTTPLTIEFTEKENGQLAADLENIIKEDICTVAKSRQLK